MSANEETLSVRLKADGTGLTGVFNAAGKKVSELAQRLNQTSKEGQQTSKKVEILGQKVQSTDPHLNRMAHSTGGVVQQLTSMRGILATLGLGLTAREMVNTITQAERMDATLETITGTTAGASAEFDRLEQFAAKTPYTLDQSVEGFIRLANLGLDPSARAMTSYGNTAAAMSKDLMQMVETVADATVGEFERLKEFGIKARAEGDSVAFTFKGVTTQVGNSASEIERHLINIGNTHFAGNMERQMERLPGLISNLKDEVSSLWRTIGDKGATDAMATGIRTVIGGVSWLKDEINSGFGFDLLQAAAELWTSTLSGGLQDIGVNLGGVNHAMKESASFVETYLGTLWETIKNGILDMPINMKTAITIMIGEADQFALSAKASFERFTIFFAASMDHYAHGWNLFTLGMQEKFNSAIDWVLNKLADGVRAIGASIPDWDLFDGLGPKLTQAANQLDLLAVGSARVQREIESENQAYQTATQSRLALLNQLIEASEQQEETHKKASQAIIQAALNERTAILSARDARLEQIRADRAWEIEAERIFDEMDLFNSGYQVGVKQSTASVKALTKAVKESADETATAALSIAQIYQDTATSIRGAFSGAFRDLLDGTSSLANRMEGIFKQMLADMATMAIARPIIIPMVTGMGGLIGVSSTAQA